MRQALNNFIGREAVDLPSLVKRLIRSRGERLIEQLNDLAGDSPFRFLRITGRAAMVDAMVTLLNQLRQGDVYKRQARH